MVPDAMRGTRCLVRAFRLPVVSVGVCSRLSCVRYVLLTYGGLFFRLLRYLVAKSASAVWRLVCRVPSCDFFSKRGIRMETFLSAALSCDVLVQNCYSYATEAFFVICFLQYSAVYSANLLHTRVEAFLSSALLRYCCKTTTRTAYHRYRGFFVIPLVRYVLQTDEGLFVIYGHAIFCCNLMTVSRLAFWAL